MQRWMPPLPGDGTGVTVEAAIAGRRCCRAFRPDPVPVELVEKLLALAARAPSGSNVQPWHVHVLTGEAKDELGAELVRAHHSGAPLDEEYAYYPPVWSEPYLSRRRKIGWDLYGLLGIARGDKERMSEQHARNYVFFGAPVGLIFTIDRQLAIGSWLDYGMFLQTIMIGARAFGLETCPQQAFAKYHAIIQKRLAIPDDRMIVVGMALGYPDDDAPVNRLTTERAPVADFTTFVGRLAVD